MNTQAVAEELLRIRRRLDEINDERKSLPAEAFGEKADLLDEEHRLRAELADLEEQSGLRRDATTDEAPTLELPAVG